MNIYNYGKFRQRDRIASESIWSNKEKWRKKNLTVLFHFSDYWKKRRECLFRIEYEESFSIPFIEANKSESKINNSQWIFLTILLLFGSKVIYLDNVDTIFVRNTIILSYLMRSLARIICISKFSLLL